MQVCVYESADSEGKLQLHKTPHLPNVSSKAPLYNPHKSNETTFTKHILWVQFHEKKPFFFHFRDSW